MAAAEESADQISEDDEIAADDPRIEYKKAMRYENQLVMNHCPLNQSNPSYYFELQQQASHATREESV